jgi:hypothetical protein
LSTSTTESSRGLCACSIQRASIYYHPINTLFYYTGLMAISSSRLTRYGQDVLHAGVKPSASLSDK